MIVFRLLLPKITKCSSLDLARLKCRIFVLGRGVYTSAFLHARQIRLQNHEGRQKSRSLQADTPFSEPSIYSNVSLRDSTENIDDIYGIESDDGAICFNDAVPRFDKFEELVGKKQMPSEILRTTSFGQVRLDSENRNHLRARRKSAVTSDKNLEVKEFPLSEKPYDKSHRQLAREKLKKLRNISDVNVSVNILQSKGTHEREKEINKKNNFNVSSRFTATNRRNATNFEDADAATSDESADKIWEQLGYSDVDYQISDIRKKGNADSQSKLEYVDIPVKEIVKPLGRTCADEFSEVDKQYFQSSESTENNLSDRNNDNLLKTSINPMDISNEIERNTISFHESPESNKPILETKKIINTSSLKDKLDKASISTFDEQYFSEILKSDNSVSTFQKKTQLNYESETKNADSYQFVHNTDVSEPQSVDSDFVGEEPSNNFSTGEPRSIGREVKRSEKSNLSEFSKIQQESSARSNALGSIDHTDRNIKLDSKGFRILTNQVPDLSTFTRAELIAELRTRILFSDEDILVLNKPYNLVIHEAATNKDVDLSSLLDEFARLIDSKSTDPKLYTVHRLDKTTTGCLLLARNEMAAQKLKGLFAQRKITKAYWIVTSGIPHNMEGIIDMPIAEGRIGNKARMVLRPDLPDDVPYKSHTKGGKRAVTEYSVIATSGNAALIEAKSETGLKHQIRVHFGFGLNCPILGDHKYSHLDKLAPQKLPSDLLQRLHVRQSKVRHIPMHIHARSISLPNYSDSRNLFVTAPLPEHIRRNLQSLKFRKK